MLRRFLPPLLVLVACQSARSTPAPTPSLASPLFTNFAQSHAALRPEFAADVQLNSTLTRYAIDVIVLFNPDGAASLLGRERVRYTNTQTFTLDSLYLMLWPNQASQFLGEMTLQNATLNGSPLTPRLEYDGLAARLDLPLALAPGASAEVETEFSVTVLPGVEQGAARFGLTNGVLLAPTFYPLVPRLVAGQWQITPASANGGATNSDVALYIWRVTAPRDLTVIGTGTAIDTQTYALTHTLAFVTGPVRDLTLVVGALEKTERVVDGLTLNVYTLPEHQPAASIALDYAEGQVRTLQSEIGPYPYAELDIADAPGAYGGVEYPGVVVIGVISNTGRFERAVVHEVGHQWFYGVVGNDQQLEPWLDESAASYTEVLHAERVHGALAAADNLQRARDYLRYTDYPYLPIGLPVADYPTAIDYGTLIYMKGKLFFATLRSQLGDDAFFAFLKNYYTAHRYGFVTARDFQQAAEAACACDLQAFFDLWVYKGGSLKN